MKKITAKILGEMQKAFEQNKGVLEKAVSEDNGTFEVVASTQSKDRHGEIVLQEGINIENYMKNPIILLSHDYWALPIGKATEVIKTSDKLIIKGVFASAEANPVAQQVRKLYEAGILKTVSIGFIAKAWEGNVCTESELLELSFVSVPANPDAMDIAKSKGVEKEFVAYTELASKKKTTPDDDNEGTKPESEELKAIKQLAVIFKEFNAGITEKLSILDNEIKNLSAEVVGIRQESVAGATKELDDLTAQSARIATQVREIIKKRSVK